MPDHLFNSRAMGCVFSGANKSFLVEMNTPHWNLFLGNQERSGPRRLEKIFIAAFFSDVISSCTPVATAPIKREGLPWKKPKRLAELPAFLLYTCQYLPVLYSPPAGSHNVSFGYSFALVRSRSTVASIGNPLSFSGL